MSSFPSSSSSVQPRLFSSLSPLSVMDTSLPLRQSILNPSSSFRTPKIGRLEPPRARLPSRLPEFRSRNCPGSLKPSSPVTIQLKRGWVWPNKTLSAPARASSGDADFSAPSERGLLQAPSFGEFITSERVKIVAMLALALALCNADRVVMSVAILPLSISHGWSRSFAGIVQVLFCCLVLAEVAAFHVHLF